MGATSGTVTLTWEAYGIPDQFDVYYEGILVYSTMGPVSGAGSAPITFGPGTETFVTVVVTGPAGTAWDYVITCPAATP